MFDVNPDAAKYYFKDLERQVAAARLSSGAMHSGAEDLSSKPSWSSHAMTLLSQVTAQPIASAVRAVVTAIF